MKKKRIWIVYCSRKGGHTYPVNALYNYINENYKTELSPIRFNFLDFSPSVSFFETIGRFGDLKFRRLWKSGYNNLKDDNKVFVKSWQWLETLLFKADRIKTKLITNGGQPDLIISFQPEINIIAPLLKKWFDVPIHTAIVDLALHSLWVNKKIDHYYLYDETMQQHIKKYGIDDSKVTVAGIPLRSDFSKIVQFNKKEIRQKLGLRETTPTLLLLGGLLGKMVDFITVINSISAQDINCQLMIVFGKNEEAKKIQEIGNWKLKIYSYGVVDNMAEMMWAADLVISKPGSVTMAESLALGKPMVVITPQAGSAQELRFASFLKENGAGEWVQDAKEVGSITKDIITNLSRLKEMNESAAKIGSKSLYANKIIVENILNALAQ